MKIRYSFIFILPFFLQACSTPEQLIVKTVQSDNISSNSKLYYALPKTVLKIAIVEKHISYKPGRFAAYAEQLFYAKPKSLLAKSSFQITAISVKPMARYDSSRVFSISNVENRMPDLSLSKEGFLRGVNIHNTESRNKAWTKVRKLQNKKNRPQNVSIAPLPQNFFKQTTEQEKAAFLAKEIYTIREDRHFLAVGESSNNQLPDGSSLAEMLNYLTNLETQYLSLFYGSENLDFDTLNFEYEPKSKSGEQQILFRFSESEGIVPNTNIDAYPIFIDINLNSNMDVSRLEERTNIVRLKSLQPSGLIYCVPANAHIVIRDEEIKLFSINLPVAQLGTLSVLPVSLFLPNISVDFDVHYGSLLNIKTKYDGE